jgi:uncharacterized cupin superfamily protein
VRKVNIFSAAIEFDPEDPEGYRAGAARLSRELEAQELALNLFEVPAGESLCPYHYEYVEEWLLVLEGELTLRTPDGEEHLVRGDLAYFPAGAHGAHKVSSRSSEPARLIMFSSGREPSVAVYPDSDKIGVWPGNSEDEVMLRRADGKVGYYEGEI